MEMPSIKILNYELELLNELDTYNALDFRRSWQGIGDFKLSACGYTDILVPGNIVMIGGDGHKAGIIRGIDLQGDNCLVYGQCLKGFTSQRTVLPLDNNGGYFSVPPIAEHRSVSAEEIVKTYISSCLGALAEDPKRRLKDHNGNLLIITAENRSRGYPTEWGCRYTQLDEELQSICEYCDCGYEIYIDLDRRVYVAEYITGTNRSIDNVSGNGWVILSEDFESVESVSYSVDYTSYKNVAYAGGKGSGADRTVLAVTNDSEPETGIRRFEIFADCGELESVETTSALSLTDAGRHKLEEYNCIEKLSANIAAAGSFQCDRDYFLGDLVTVQIKDIGLQQNMRVSETLESYEPGNHKLQVVLGKSPKRFGRAIRAIQPAIR